MVSGQANGKRHLRTVGLQSALLASLGSSDCWLLGSCALPAVELRRVRRAQRTVSISGLFRAGLCVSLRSLSGPARGPPQVPGARTGARLSIRPCAEKGQREGRRPPGHRVPRVPRRIGGWALWPPPQLNLAAPRGCSSGGWSAAHTAPRRVTVPRRPAETGQGLTQGIRWTTKGGDWSGAEQCRAEHTATKWVHACASQIHSPGQNLQTMGGAKQRDSICLSSTLPSSSPTWSSG